MKDLDSESKKAIVTDLKKDNRKADSMVELMVVLMVEMLVF
jgi:hypothetical protein